MFETIHSFHSCRSFEIVESFLNWLHLVPIVLEIWVRRFVCIGSGRPQANLLLGFLYRLIPYTKKHAQLFLFAVHVLSCVFNLVRHLVHVGDCLYPSRLYVNTIRKSLLFPHKKPQASKSPPTCARRDNQFFNI